MKKVLLLMAGVLLISGTAMAANAANTTGTTLSDLGVKNDAYTESDTVDVKVRVEQYAEVEITQTDLDLTGIDKPGESKEGYVEFTVNHNDDINLALSGVYFDVDSDEDVLLLEADILANNTDTAFVAKEESTSYLYTDTSGTTTRNIAFEATWLNDADTSANWYDIQAGEYSTTVQLTVSATGDSVN